MITRYFKPVKSTNSLKNNKTLITVIAALFFSTTCYPAYSHNSANNTSLNRLIIFGDSLSDNGNTYALTRDLHESIDEIPIVPDPDYYWYGRFSDGPVWNEFLAGLLGLISPERQTELRKSPNYLNYAYGGAWAESYQPDEDAWHTLPPSLEGQVDDYLDTAKLNQDDLSHDLVTIWMGGNDYLNQELTGVPIARELNISTQSVLNAMLENLNKLYAAGVRHFLLLGLPDLGRVPNAVLHDPWQQNISPALSQLSLLHNQKLFQLTQDFSRSHADTTIVYIDINQLFMHEFDDAEQRYEEAGASHQLTPQKATHPCLLEAVDPDLSLMRAFPHNPILALSAQPKAKYSYTPRQSSIQASLTSYRHCDLHQTHDQASSLNYQENYLAGGIFFDHIHPLTPIHAKIALAVCQQLLNAGVYFSGTNSEELAQKCQNDQLGNLLKHIEQAPFPMT